MKISVFAASSSKIHREHFATASKLGVEIVKNGHQIVFGGGETGLMGALADSALNEGGIVTGVIPEFMVKNGWGHISLSNMIITEDMNSRKKKIFEISDAVIALPGGVGTLEELTEAITLKQLGQFSGPIVILNVGGFYNTLLSFIDHLVEGNFMRQEHKDIWEISDSPAKAIQYINEYTDWNRNFVKSVRM